MTRPTILYTPQGQSFKGSRDAFPILRTMVRELLSSRELIWRLFYRDFSARYRQSLLGITWAILAPLTTVGTFVVMNRSGLVTIAGTSVPYPLHAMIGLTIWGIFSTGLTAASGALINAGSMITKINFPKSSLIFAATGQSAVEFLIRALLVVGAFLWYGIAPHWPGVIVGLVALVPICLMTLGAGFVLSLVAGVFRDLVNAINPLLMGLLLFTPVLYPLPPGSLIARINVFNPINYLVSVPRELIVRGHTELTSEFLIAALLSVAVFLMGWRLFVLAQARITERV